MNVKRVNIVAVQTKCATTILVVSTVWTHPQSRHRMSKDVVQQRLKLVTSIVPFITQIWVFHANVWKMKMAQDNVMHAIQVR